MNMRTARQIASTPFQVVRQLSSDALSNRLLVSLANGGEQDRSVLMFFHAPDGGAEALLRAARARGATQQPVGFRAELMDFQDGQTVAAWYHSDAIDLATLLSKLWEGGRGLTAAQASKIVWHVTAALAAAWQDARDLDEESCHGFVVPSFILITPALEARLIGFEFGIELATCCENKLRTQFGRYLSPEVRAGGSPSSSDDVYSLGALLFELLDGAPPEADFFSGSINFQDRDVAENQPLCASLAVLLSQSLASREHRFADVKEWEQALDSALFGAWMTGSTPELNPLMLHVCPGEEIENARVDSESDEPPHARPTPRVMEGLGEVTSAALDEQYAPSGTRSPGAEPSASETSIPVAESTEAAAASPSVEAAGWRNRWAGVLRYAAVALLAAGAGWGFSGSWRPVQTSAQDMRLAQTVSGAAMMDLKRQEVPDLESTVLGAVQPDSSDGLQDLPGATDGFDSRSLKESAAKEISIPPVALRETPAAARAGRSEPLIVAAMPETRIEETTPQERQPVGGRVSTANEATPESAEDTQSVDQVAASDERVEERGNRSPKIDLPEVWVDQLVEAGPGVVAPQLIRRPRVRLAGGENAEVRTRVLVDYRGSVIDVVVLDADRVSQGDRSRVEAAARRVKFRSATKNDVPVRMWAELTF